MRILWFVNTPSLATEKLTGKVGIGGGWIESLEQRVSRDPTIQLGLAFRWSTPKVKPLQVEHSPTQYYLLPKYPQGKLSELWGRVIGSIEPIQELDDFQEVIKAFQPDMIHIFGTEQGFGQIASIVDLPIVVWIQGNLTACTDKWFTGISKWDSLRYARLSEIMKGKTFWHKYIKNLKMARREREIFKVVRHFIGRTDWDRRLTSTLAPQAQYHHCDEVMRAAFYRREWFSHGKRDKVVLLTTIRSSIYKGLETLFRTAALLQQLIGDRFTWRVAGISSDDVLVRVTTRGLGLKYGDLPVELLGNQSPAQLIEELINTDMFVHPSHVDNSPNSVCEAMLMGVPVVSTNVGGIPSLVENNKEGLLVQNGDPWALAGAILDLISDPKKAVDLGQRARERAVIRHDPDTIYDDLINIYSQLVKAKSNILSE